MTRAKNLSVTAIVLSLISVVSLPLYAQVTTNTGLTPAQLVNNVLLGGGITAGGITYTGYPNAVSQFNSPVSSNLGFTTGLYLTTGSSMPFDPNNSFSMGQDGPTGPNTNFQSFDQTLAGFGAGDPDLDVLFQSLICNTTGDYVTNDAAVLEFDFIPTSDSISFRYRFGSEEYNTFVSPLCSGSGVNDVFAFFLTGVTTPFPQTNIALLPGGTPVSIFTVNNGVNEPASGPCVNCTYFVDNSVTQVVNVTYDGLTRILTASAPVICGETYHIKLAIADGADNVYDSGVFIEGGSFTSAGGVEVISNINPNTGDSMLLENCVGTEVTFRRNGDVSAPDSISYTLGGTATSGGDYTGLTGSLFFPAGISTITVPITAIQDGVPEGIETIVITIASVGCISTTVTEHTIYINEPGPVTVNAGSDVSLDCSTLQAGAGLTAVYNGGIGPYSFAWSSGGTTASVNVNTAGNHIVTVTDFCNQAATDTVTITVINANPLTLTASNDTMICPGSPLTLVSLAGQGNGGIEYTWSTGANTPNINVAPVVSTVYSITVIDDCGLVATEMVNVDVDPVHAAFNQGFTGVEGEVLFNNLSLPPGSTYQWSFGDGATSTDENPQHTYEEAGKYTVLLIVTNPNGCIDSILHIVDIKRESFIFIPNTFTPGNGDGINDVFRVHGNGFTEGSLRVYNRWGQEIHATSNNDLTWNGTRGDDTVCPQGVYAYRIDYTDGLGKRQTILGHINLVR